MDRSDHQEPVSHIEGARDEAKHPRKDLGLVLVHEVAPVDGQLKNREHTDCITVYITAHGYIIIIGVLPTQRARLACTGGGGPFR